MNRKELMEDFNHHTRIGSLATSDAKGEVNAAVFGSPRMVDENTVVMGIGQNRSLKNLKENPKAVFLFVIPAQSSQEWKGARVYLQVESIETEGPLFENIRNQIREVAGERSASAMYAAIRFNIKDVRPLIASS